MSRHVHTSTHILTRQATRLSKTEGASCLGLFVHTEPSPDGQHLAAEPSHYRSLSIVRLSCCVRSECMHRVKSHVVGGIVVHDQLDSPLRGAALVRLYLQSPQYRGAIITGYNDNCSIIVAS